MDTDWTKTLELLPTEKADIYFSNNYYDLFASYENADARCFTFKNNGQIALYPFLLSSVNELGYKLDTDYFDIQGAYGYNGVLTNSYDSRFTSDFYTVFEEFCAKNNIIAEFTRFHPVLQNQEFSKHYMTTTLDRETTYLDLTKSYDDIWSTQYSSKNRNMIRKARKNGYTMQVITSPTTQDIENFVSIYHYTMKMASADRYYYFDREFFFNTFSFLKENSILMNILNADGLIVCSSIFLRYNDYFHYHLSGRSELADNSVNSFLLDEAIKFAKETRSKIFHLGGGRSADPDDSLLKYKSSFSKTRLPFYIGKKIHNKTVYDEIINQWERKYPEKQGKYENYLLKYRY